MISVEFLELAQQELDNTFKYYEHQQNDLGYKFIQEAYNSISLIQMYPLAWSKNSENTRRCLVKTFPYSIIYQKREEIILIVAIANLHKKPNYWVDRIK